MKKKKENKETFTEVFDVEKDGKEKTLIVESQEKESKEDKPIKKNQLNKEKKVFLGIVIVMISMLAFFGIFYFVINSPQYREYKGVEFQLVKEGKLLFYRTFIPIIYNDKPANYNFYLRTDPNIQKLVEFNSSNISLKKIVVINQQGNFSCNGYGAIAIANLANLYKIIGANVITDPNATCDSQSRYNYINIIKGEKTKVNVYGKDNECFEIQVKDCEILKGTEKLMLEIFVEFNKEED